MYHGLAKMDNLPDNFHSEMKKKTDKRQLTVTTIWIGLGGGVDKRHVISRQDQQNENRAKCCPIAVQTNQKGQMIAWKMVASEFKIRTILADV